MTHLIAHAAGLVVGSGMVVWGALTGNIWMVVWAAVGVCFAVNGLRHELAS